MVTGTQPKTRSTWVMDPAHSSVEFAAKHMVISSVRGRFGKLEIHMSFDQTQPERSQVEARIDAASIDTKQPDRDAHLRSPDFLNADKFPWITFKSRRIESSASGHHRIVGDLTIREVTREVFLDAEYAGIAKDPMGNLHAGFSAAATINRRDFGLIWNMALETGGFLVGDTVRINIELEVVRQDS
ncbi:MAG: YceI family protein [Chloroflexi bacterium]|nr:YceI family protein [Chloroflexota bacterium]